MVSSYFYTQPFSSFFLLAAGSQVKLEAGDSPLTFRGIPVDFNHLRIVRIDRPTTATVHPVLEILSGHRYLYSRIAGVL